MPKLCVTRLASFSLVMSFELLSVRAAHAGDEPPPSLPTTSVAPSPVVAAPIVSEEKPSGEKPTPPRGVVWHQEWPKFQPVEYGITGAMLLGTGAFIVFGKEGDPNWTGPILFDEGARNAFRANNHKTRQAWQIVGDAFYYGGLAYPFIVDTLAVTWIGHKAPKVASQMFLINTEAFAITGFFSFLSNATIRRQRPYVRECGAGKPDPVFPDCDVAGQSEGFYSGHTAIAFTGAALTCMHHANLPLYGDNGVGGAVACVTLMTGATVGGVARLIADKHYASDVIVGAGVGLASGIIVPWLHYRHRSKTGDASTANQPVFTIAPAPLLSPTTAGLGAMGLF